MTSHSVTSPLPESFFNGPPIRFWMWAISASVTSMFLPSTTRGTSRASSVVEKSRTWFERNVVDGINAVVEDKQANVNSERHSMVVGRCWCLGRCCCCCCFCSRCSCCCEQQLVMADALDTPTHSRRKDLVEAVSLMTSDVRLGSLRRVRCPSVAFFILSITYSH